MKDLLVMAIAAAMAITIQSGLIIFSNAPKNGLKQSLIQICGKKPPI
jgi:hypothetical protein